MIPITLELKNFLSYGQRQAINFGNHHLICLCGKNGHGKSALLDAITWAVWGQARKISGAVKPDAQLLRLGQTRMSVCFDFIFNDTTYRIKREFLKNQGKAVATLDFGIMQQDGSLLALTDKTIKLTQQKIEKTIGLDYESFINTAFLRQGQSNEFSKKSPKDRKEILAAILGLNTYERVRKAALDKIRSLQANCTLLQSYQQKLALELQHKEIIAQECTLITQKTTTIDSQCALFEQKLAAAHKEKDALKEHLRSLEQLEAQVIQVQASKTAHHEKLCTTRTAWRQCNKELNRLQPFKIIEAAYTQAKQRLTIHQQALEKNLELKNILLALKEQEQKAYQQAFTAYQEKVSLHKLALQQTEAHHAALLGECKLLVRTIKEHADQLKELEAAQQKGTQECMQLKPLQEQYTTQEKAFEKRKSMYHLWQARAQELKKELIDIQQKQAMTTDQLNPSCPLCEQNLSASRKKLLKAQFENRIHALKHRLTRLATALPALKQLLIDQNAHLTIFKNQLLEYTRIETRLAEMNQSSTKTATTLQELEAREQALLRQLQETQKLREEQTEVLNILMNNQEKELEQHEQFTQLKKERRALETTLNQQVYDQKAHEKEREQYQHLEQQISLHLHRQEQHAQQEQRKQEIFVLIKALKGINKELAHLEKNKQAHANLNEKQATIETLEQQLLANIKELQHQKEMLCIEKGKAQQHLTSLQKVEKQFQQQQKELNTHLEMIKDYQQISTALSKDGIQALLIEEAIPEIEHETNLILSQLTNNQAHIIIESLKDLQKGGTKETLDIKISDASGIRPYEMFSGGEAFRIDFALRIAISKLLARRAGTCLQTLIIDEGFGSQDEEGLSNIMDAIHAIQDNFAKIIIVSHLPMMKDQFPVHFLIEKGAQGSCIKVIEQG